MTKECFVADKSYPGHKEVVGKYAGLLRTHCQRCGQWLEEIVAQKTNGELEVCKTLVAGSTPACASKD